MEEETAKSNFVVTFELDTTKEHADVINERMEILRRMYNNIVRTFNKRHVEMTKSKAWRKVESTLYQPEVRKELLQKRKAFEKDSAEYTQITDELSSLKDKIGKEERAALLGMRNSMLKAFEFSEWGIYGKSGSGVGWKQYNYYKGAGINANNTMRLCSNIWSAYEKLLFGKGKKINFKRYGELNSIQGKNNKSAIVIRFDSNNIPYVGISNFKIPILINLKKKYEYEAMYNREIILSSITRKLIRGSYKYYIQITFRGKPYSKPNQTMGVGNVGIDIGTQTIAVAADNFVMLRELASRTPNYENRKRLILRAMDRSRRIANPDNYNEDGTIKKGIIDSNTKKRTRLKWKTSQNYLKLKAELTEICRKKADITTLQHNELANEIIKLGDVVKVEKMSFSGLAKKTKNAGVNKKGKNKTRKRFGKSIANKAPAKLLTILKNKLSAKGGSFLEIDPKTLKPSQYNHQNGECVKKKLSQRWNHLSDDNGNTIKVQRDLYSALLIKNIDAEAKKYDDKTIKNDFNDFIVLHNQEIKQLEENNTKKLSSFGIKKLEK